MKLSEIAVDLDKEREGEWVPIPSLRGVELKVRGIRNNDYRQALQQSLRKLQRKYGDQPIPVQVQDKMQARLLARHVLVDWSGITDDDTGKVVKYTPDLGEEVLADPQYRKLADAVSWAASTVGDQDEEDLEEDSGNSGAPSAGD